MKILNEAVQTPKESYKREAKLGKMGGDSLARTMAARRELIRGRKLPEAMEPARGYNETR